MSPAEPRQAVVAAAKAMAAEGLVRESEGNVSVRDGELVHITPRALAYDEMSAADVVTLDLAGEVVAGEREPSSERRVHLAIYAARPDVGAVVHTHSVHATRWSSRGQPLSAGTEEGETVATAQSAPAGTDELACAVVEALGSGGAVLMASHGVVAVAADLPAALEVARHVERRAKVASNMVGRRVSPLRFDD